MSNMNPGNLRLLLELNGMNLRILVASAALCGAVLICCGRAEAQALGVVFGYAGGATFKGEVYGGYGAWGDCGGSGYGCSSGNCGGGARGGKQAGGGCSSCKTKRNGRGKGCGGGRDFGCDYGCDDCYEGAPAEGALEKMPELKPTPAPAANEASNRRDMFRAVAHEQIENPSFAQGWLAYRKGNYRLALETLSAVVVTEPHNAAARYGLALSNLQLGDRDAADAALAQAAAVEAEHPIAGYGKLMERVQGRERLWLEAARR